MRTAAAETVPATARRVRWRRALAALLCVLAPLGFLGWRSYRNREERLEALELVHERGFAEAEAELRRVHERQPQNVEIARALADGYFKARQFREARAVLDQWCDFRPNSLEPFQRRLDLSGLEQKIPACITDAENILRLNPDDFVTRKLLAQLLAGEGRFEEAEKEALRCYNAERGNAEVWYLLAYIYRGQKKNDLAALLLDQYLRKEPANPTGVKLRAQLYLDHGQPEPAIRLLQHFVAGPRQNPVDGLYELSLALEAAAKHDEAKKVLTEMQWRRALQIWSTNEQKYASPGAQEQVVQAMLAAGKTDDAVTFLCEILKQNPGAPAATHRMLADCYEKQGHAELALEHRRLAERGRDVKEKGR
jgi:predicted Zn-dependent protease